ncbi:hypothetical protein DFH09DRAFT_1292090 [Mycena vulgaris]|nr:hypothetical protein DFH09DRAFT_1292090 [Mycena vulgaris]
MLSLETELGRLKTSLAAEGKKDESRIVRRENQEHVSEDVVLVVDSEDELGSEEIVNSPPVVTDLEGQPSPLTISKNLVADSAAPSANAAVKDEVMDVVIKTEGEPDQFTRVTLTKSEDGSSFWNVDGFDLGPTIQVDEKYNRGFTRKVISDALGGGHVRSYHHWSPRSGKTPHLTFSRSWSPGLPASPGMHGMGFCSMNDCPVKPRPLNFSWAKASSHIYLIIFLKGRLALGGDVYISLLGEIAPHHVSLIPQTVLDNWVKGRLSGEGGKAIVHAANATLEEARRVDFTYESVLQACLDGRLAIPFTILQCVGYPEDLFESLVYYEENPKPPKKKSTGTGKRRGKKAQRSPRKQPTRGGRTTKREESSSEDESDELSGGFDDSESEFLAPARQIAALPTRTSPRKLARAMSRMAGVSGSGSGSVEVEVHAHGSRSARPVEVNVAKTEVNFKFIDGEGLQAILVDGNKPQANALGA